MDVYEHQIDGIVGRAPAKSVSFFAPGDPKGQPRPRAFSRGGHARVYDPGTAEGWKQSIAVACNNAKPKKFAGPIRLEATFYFRRPKSHLGKRGILPSAPRHHIQKPDSDNLAKAVADALTNIRVWDDDCQVVEMHCAKVWADPGGQEPGARIIISELEPQPTGALPLETRWGSK